MNDRGGYFPRWTLKTEGRILPDERLPAGQTVVLGLQHVVAMFGSTVLAPILMGFDPNVSILFSGISTLIFFIAVGGRVPSYLGSSFAFIGPVLVATGAMASAPNPNIALALGGIIVAGAIYALIGLDVTPATIIGLLTVLSFSLYDTVVVFDKVVTLGQCERDVQERMVWHFFLVHDDYGRRVGEKLGISAEDVSKLGPLPKQVLTDEDQRRLQNLGNNGDKIDPTVWGQWTSSVENYKASAEEVLMGKLPNEGMTRSQAAE